MSNLGGEIGGKAGGGVDVNQSQYPSFTSPGGITPQQSALSEYDYGQNLLEGQAQFEGGDQGGGISDSTMATQVAGGANIGKALTSAGMSDVNQGAEYGAYENAINIDQQNNANLLAEQNYNLNQATNQQTTLGSLAGSAAAGATPGSSQ